LGFSLSSQELISKDLFQFGSNDTYWTSAAHIYIGSNFYLQRYLIENWLFYLDTLHWDQQSNLGNLLRCIQIQLCMNVLSQVVFTQKPFQNQILIGLLCCLFWTCVLRKIYLYNTRSWYHSSKEALQIAKSLPENSSPQCSFHRWKFLFLNYEHEDLCRKTNFLVCYSIQGML